MMGRLRRGHPFLRAEEFAGRAAGPVGRRPAVPATLAESVPPAAPAGAAGRDGSRWLPSRVPTSLAIDRIVKESIRRQGRDAGGAPVIRAAPSDAIGRSDLPREAIAPAVGSYLSYDPPGRPVR